MKIPGPDHPITVTAAPRRVRVIFQGHTIVDSDNALVLKEAAYKPVYYFPREDVSMEYLARTDHSTHCPYKGDASYFTLAMDGRIEENAVWSYEHPFEHMGIIEGLLAFYPDRIDEIHDHWHLPYRVCRAAEARVIRPHARFEPVKDAIGRIAIADEMLRDFFHRAVHREVVLPRRDDKVYLEQATVFVNFVVMEQRPARRLADADAFESIQPGVGATASAEQIGVGEQAFQILQTRQHLD